MSKKVDNKRSSSGTGNNPSNQDTQGSQKTQKSNRDAQTDGKTSQPRNKEKDERMKLNDDVDQE